MFSLLFFARLTFLTGLFFAASWGLLLVEHGLNPELVSTILTIGFGFGLVLFPCFGLICLVLSIRGQFSRSNLPRWLVMGNFIWLILFITFILYLNGPYYHQP